MATKKKSTRTSADQLRRPPKRTSASQGGSGSRRDKIKAVTVQTDNVNDPNHIFSVSVYENRRPPRKGVMSAQRNDWKPSEEDKARGRAQHKQKTGSNRGKAKRNRS